MRQEGKSMVIVWKWEDLSDQYPPSFLCNEVKGRPNTKVVRVNLVNSDRALAFLASYVKECLYHGPLMVFLHKDHGYTNKAVSKLKTQFEAITNDQLKFVAFGGGADFIYYSASELGLLDDFGWFMDEQEYEFKNPYAIPKIGQASVGAYNEKGEWEIDANYFDQVWNFYHGSLPQKTFQLKRDFIDLLYPIWLSLQNNDYPSSEPEFQKTLNDCLMSRLASFCGLATNEHDQMLINEENRSGRSLRFFMPLDLPAISEEATALNHQYQAICQSVRDFMDYYQEYHTLEQTWLENLPRLNEEWSDFVDGLYRTHQPS